MRILLVQPPVQDFYQTPCRTYPLGLTYLAAVLLEEGFEVEILDAHQPGLRKTIPLPDRFRYIRKYYALDNKSPYRLFNHYYHFGLELPDIERRIRRSKPDLVGISSLFSPYSDLALDISRVVKKINSHTITVMGGHHVWSMPEHVFMSGVVDYVIRGEGEWSFLRLCRELAQKKKDGERLAKIPGIGFMRGDTMTLHPEYALVDDLDSLPLPARDLLDPEAYTVGGRRYTMLLTTRGCPHTCGFCALPTTPCSLFRKRPPERVLAEVGECYEKYQIRHFDIEDDNFTLDRTHAKNILKGFRGLSMDDARLSAMNGVAADSLTPELTAEMRESGFTHLDLAVVTSDRDRRRTVSRPGSLTQFSDILEHVRAQAFRTTVHMILGLPEDSIENMLETLLFLMAKPCLIGASIYYPVPGSELFDRHPDHIRFSEPAFWRSTLASCESYDGQRDAYMTLFYLTRIVNYMKHLMVRHPISDQQRGPKEMITLWFAELLQEKDREKLHARVIERETRWEDDAFGVFMLRRFEMKRQIEKVEVRKRAGKTVYLFSDDFGDRELIERFWTRAEGLNVDTTGEQEIRLTASLSGTLAENVLQFRRSF